jgi:hypothetical protein
MICSLSTNDKLLNASNFINAENNKQKPRLMPVCR